IAEARATHPFVSHGDRHERSATYRNDAGEPFHRALSAPPTWAAAFAFDVTTLDDARRFVGAYAARERLLPTQDEEVAVVVGELVTNSVRHGGGAGVVRVW